MVGDPPLLGALVSAVVAEGLTAEQSAMVTANLPLIGWTLNRYGRGMLADGYTGDDAWQEGFFGLCRAVQKFEPERGIKFSAYAVTWIRQAMQRGAGNLHGLDYRRAHVGRTGDPWRPALSLSTQVGAEEVELVDLLPGPDDVEGEAVSSSAAGDLLAFAHRQCVDDLDRDLIAWLAEPDGRTVTELHAALATRHGVTAGTVRVHLSRLRARCRLALAEAA